MDSLAFLSETAPEPVAVESVLKPIETPTAVEEKRAAVEEPILPQRQTREKPAKIKMSKKKAQADAIANEPVPKKTVLSPLQNTLPSLTETKTNNLLQQEPPSAALDPENAVVEPKVSFSAQKT